MNEVIKAVDLTKIYNKRDKKKRGKISVNLNQVLNGVSLEVYHGDFISIMGKSGCGKTTLLKILGGIEEATTGRAIVGDINLSSCSDEILSDVRQKIVGFVFQEFYLVDSLTLKENILLPLYISNKPYREIESLILENAKRFEIEKILDKYPTEVSGGEKQRTAICRAIINEPKIILADEPTGNLDSINSEIVIKYFERLNLEENRTILMVTHDPTIASYSKKVLLMKDGAIVKQIEKENGEDKKSFIQRIVEIMDY